MSFLNMSYNFLKIFLYHLNVAVSLIAGVNPGVICYDVQSLIKCLLLKSSYFSSSILEFAVSSFGRVKFCFDDGSLEFGSFIKD